MSTYHIVKSEVGARKACVPTIVSSNTRIVNISPKMLQPKSMYLELVNLLSMMVETDTLLSVLAREVERQMGGDCHVVGFFQKHETENIMDPRQSVGDYDLGKGETIYVLFGSVPPTEQAVAVEEQAAAVAEETEEETEEAEEAVEEAEEAVEEGIRIVVKQPYKCGYCKVTGHNKRTCRLFSESEQARERELAEAEQAREERDQAWWADMCADLSETREQAEAEQARERELAEAEQARERRNRAYWADVATAERAREQAQEQAEAEQEQAEAEQAREQAAREQAVTTFFCPVCMDDTEQSMKAPMPCSHDLCVVCYQGIISHQQNPNCPCCRAPFVDLVSTVVQPVPVSVVAAQPRRPRRRYKCSNCREEGHNITRCPYANAGSALGHYGIRVSDLQYGVGGPPDPASGW